MNELEMKNAAFKNFSGERDKLVEQLQLDERKKVNELESKKISEISALRKEHDQ